MVLVVFLEENNFRLDELYEIGFVQHIIIISNKKCLLVFLKYNQTTMPIKLYQYVLMSPLRA